MSDKMQRWQGPPLTELAPLENSISNKLSNSRNTFVDLREPDIRDILAEGRDVVVRGLVLTPQQRGTILAALQFASETEGCDIELNLIDSAIQALTSGGGL
jgi:hypothetical protein